MPTIADPNPPFGEVPEPGETSTLFDAYSQVDVARSEYFGACTQYAATPATYKTDEINRTINEYADRVDTLMHLIGEEENCDPVRFIKIASGVLVTEDSERTNLFESLVGEGKFQKLVDVRDAIEQQVVEEVSEAASNEEATHAALHEFMDMLRGGLTVDLIPCAAVNSSGLLICVAGEWELQSEDFDFLAEFGQFGFVVAAVNGLFHPFGDCFHVFFDQAASGNCWGSEPDAARAERRQSVISDGVLVEGQANFIQRFFDDFAVQAEAAVDIG
jgi:hypothetical protein